MSVVSPRQLTALADLAHQRPAADITWQYIAESMAHELRRLAAASATPATVEWAAGHLDRRLRHARLPHGVTGITVDLHSGLVLDGVATLLPEHAALRGWALVQAAELCRHQL